MAGPKHIHEFERRRRRLPHLEEPGATYLLTLSLTMPPAVDLTRKDIAPIIIDALRHRDQGQYLLYDYVVMPDHVHLILKPLPDQGRSIRLTPILHSLKAWTGKRINEVVGRRGRLWQRETYDHVIHRRGEYERWSAYVHDNPHRKGSVGDDGEWPWWGQGSGRYEG